MSTHLHQELVAVWLAADHRVAKVSRGVWGTRKGLFKNERLAVSACMIYHLYVLWSLWHSNMVYSMLWCHQGTRQFLDTCMQTARSPGVALWGYTPTCVRIRGRGSAFGPSDGLTRQPNWTSCAERPCRAHSPLCAACRSRLRKSAGTGKHCGAFAPD